MDGNFTCIDPYLGTNYHLLSDVKNSKLETQIGNFLFLNIKIKSIINKGIIKILNISKFNSFFQKEVRIISHFLKKPNILDQYLWLEQS